VYDNHTAKFIDFICHILGLRKLQTRSEAISKEFDEFIAEHNDLKADQIQFLSLIKSFILDKGVVEKEDLIAPPLANLHPQGIRGVFSPKQLDQVLAFISEMGQRAQ
jgi:type I restriction enzyme R subunit